ncbi:uncharacterized protein N0V89_008196 [Didymosphaeria variabile]|uniref:Heterokaryon incompatibility domain-containing protein n=1 Tax=Didymosphaeria variabile TaxID=1932322 RepID=A0A9W9C7K6_9PLEO|nr:uncharacterized protein N0V89_008196 [Didymosphaeria variabile]KAJ4349580.1 hypothetical protein N0V89_008196 [Didymosphaeria variabile]
MSSQIAQRFSRTQAEFQPSSTASEVIEQDEELIASLQSRPSSLCARCARYDIVGAFTESKPLDDVEILKRDELGPDAQTTRRQYYDSLRPFKLRLGCPSEIVLTPSCQLCRLLYWILPRKIEDAELEVQLEPYPAHIRESGWDILPEYTKKHSAVFLGLASIESLLMSGISQPLNATSDHMMQGMMTGPAIGIEMPSPDRSAYNVQEYGSAVDLSLLRKSLDYCLENHGSFCQLEKPEEISEISVIDVFSRKVIPYLEQGDYVALSYVWGGVKPQKEALANGCLPQTIEDAIFVTKGSERNDPDPPELVNGRMRLFDGMLHEYTNRRMTNDSDSLNAFLGMISAFERRLFKTKFLHGLPLSSHPTSLAWMHDRKSAPRRRPAFPSWCWSGWEGVVSFPEDVLHSFDNQQQTTDGVDQEKRSVIDLRIQKHRFVEIDLEPHIESCDGNELTVTGWFVRLTIHTEPFSEVFIPGVEEPVAAVLERNFLHSNTLETGTYLCLVVQRHIPRDEGRGSVRQKVFIVVLERKGDWVERRTMATLTMWGGHDFFVTKPEKQNMKIH